MLKILDLDKFRPLFRDIDSFNGFVEAIKKLTSGQQLSPLVIDGNVVGLIASPGIAKKMMIDSLVNRASKNPELLSELIVHIDS